MGRRPCCAKVGLNRGAWTAREDRILSNYVTIHGEGKWRDLPQKAGLKRCGKSCRLRWLNYLRPDIRRGNISVEEEELIIRLHKLLGNRWSLIAGRLPGRTDNEIKNYWNTKLCKKLQGQNSQSPDKQLKILKKKEIIVKSHPVIRTKAIRITKAINIPQQQQQQQQQLDNQMIIKKDHESSSSPLGSGILIDFDFTDLFLSDVNLNSEFHELGKEGNKENGNGDYGNGTNMYLDYELEALLNNSLDDEALLENWRPNDHPLQPNDQSVELNAFASLLEFSEDHEY